ncbi:MAG: 30S ribosomal protein S13 [Deltaproteobacteria bacterium]|nr:30S ribosomal protein S13 [Deltaproteobacteria bacterium]
MARIAGIELPRNKRVEIGLTYIYGIGRSIALKILADAGVNPGKKTDVLTDEEVVNLRRVIDQSYRVEGDLRRDLASSIKRHIDIGSYRGLRHRRNLPARGQRTRTNSRTRKGPRRTVAGKKQAPTPK